MMIKTDRNLKRLPSGARPVTSSLSTEFGSAVSGSPEGWHNGWRKEKERADRLEKLVSDITEIVNRDNEDVVTEVRRLLLNHAFETQD